VYCGLCCDQAFQIDEQLAHLQSLVAKLDTFHNWVILGNSFVGNLFNFVIIPNSYIYQGCEVGVDIEETELRLDRLELTLPLWLCVA
jgi:hypothetical protein